MTKDNIPQSGYNPDEIRILLDAIAPPGEENKTYKSGNHAIAALHKVNSIRATRPWLFRKKNKAAQNAIEMLGEKPESGLYSGVLAKSDLLDVQFCISDELQEDNFNTFDDQATTDI